MSMRRFRKSSFFSGVVVTTVLAVVGTTFLNKIQELISWFITPGGMWTVFLLLACMIIIIIMLQRIYLQVEELHSKSRLSVRYHSLSEPGGVESVYNESRKFIEEAEEDDYSSIKAVNSFVEMFKESESKEAELQKRRYFEAIERKIGRVDYHRLLQLDNEHLEEGKLSDRIADSYREHFIKILEKKGTSKKQVALDQVPAKYPTSFVIIKNKHTNYLIWQINEHVVIENEVTDAIKLRGVFLIVDPDKQIIQHFETWFKEIENTDRKRSISKEDLEKQESSSLNIESERVMKDVQNYYRYVDEGNWDAVLTLFSTNIFYKRGSNKLIDGKPALEKFYKQERKIAEGNHVVKVTVSPPNVYVSGSFAGKLVSEEYVEVDFVDVFKFEGRKIVKRVTAFHGQEI